MESLRKKAAREEREARANARKEIQFRRSEPTERSQSRRLTRPIRQRLLRDVLRRKRKRAGRGFVFDKRTQTWR